MVMRLSACILLFYCTGCATNMRDVQPDYVTSDTLESFQTYPDDSTEKLIWSPDKRLAWHDFRRLESLAQTEAAQSWTGVEFSGNCDDNGEFSFEVAAIFHRDSSWVVSRRGDERLLEHEQGHFDLAEIYARKLSRAMHSLATPCEDIEETGALIQTLLNLNQQELEEEQRRYDIETRHGTSKRKQEAWTESLKHRLFTTETSAENRKTP